MLFNPGNEGTLKSTTFESALAEMLIILKVAENAAANAGILTEPRIHLTFDAYSKVISFSGSISFDFKLDPANRSVIFDCQEYLP